MLAYLSSEYCEILRNFVESFTCLDLECERDLGEGDWLCPLEPDLARDGDALFLDLPPCTATPRPPPVEPAGEVLSDMLLEVSTGSCLDMLCRETVSNVPCVNGGGGCC